MSELYGDDDREPHVRTRRRSGHPRPFVSGADALKHPSISPEQAKYPNMASMIGRRETRKDMSFAKGPSPRAQAMIDLWEPYVKRLEEQAVDRYDLAEVASMARAVIRMMGLTRKTSIHQKYAEMLRRMFGHDSSTVKVSAQLPATDILERWKRQKLTQSVETFIQIEAKVVDALPAPEKKADDGAQANHG